jgi:ATP-dependent DNA helicase DinG
VLCDPRLLTKGYGRAFLDSLPPMRRTRSMDDVRTFLGARLGTAGAAPLVGSETSPVAVARS